MVGWLVGGKERNKQKKGKVMGNCGRGENEMPPASPHRGPPLENYFAITV